MKEQLDNAKKVLVVIETHADLDDVVSALSLCKVLSQADKKVTLLMPENKYTAEIFRDFPPGDIKIIGKNEPDSFIVRLGSDDAIVKDVKWQEEEGKLNIYVTTFKGKIDQTKINVEPNYAVFDLIIFVGVEDTANLGDFYQNNKKAFPKSKIIQIGNVSKSFGVHKFDKESACMAHLVSQFLFSNGYSTDSDIATDLVAALLWKTQGLKYNSTVEVIDTLGELAKKGANLSSATEKAYNRLKFAELKLINAITKGFRLIDKQNAYALVNKKDIQGVEIEKITANNWTFLEDIQEIENAFILIEKEKGTRIIIKSTSPKFNAKKVLTGYEGYEAHGSNNLAQIDSEKELKRVEEDLMKALNSSPLPSPDIVNPVKKESKDKEEEASTSVSSDPLQPATELPEPLALNKENSDS